jgi:hypothetical protein
MSKNCSFNHHKQGSTDGNEAIGGKGVARTDTLRHIRPVSEGFSDISNQLAKE